MWQEFACLFQWEPQDLDSAWCLGGGGGHEPLKGSRENSHLHILASAAFGSISQTYRHSRISVWANPSRWEPEARSFLIKNFRERKHSLRQKLIYSNSSSSSSVAT